MREKALEQENTWTIDTIIQKIFPILGVMMIVSGLGYFFYTGFWEMIGQVGRIALGFTAGGLMIIGGYTFEDKLKSFSDSIIGGGILMLYVTLIYGSRFDFAEGLTSGVFPESFVLIVATLFAGAISFYAKERNSKIILTVGMLGAYATPFFIGQADGFATDTPYQISYFQFLLYFLAINISLFVSSFRMNLFSLMGLNSLGLFLGTLSISGLIGEGISEYPVLIPLLAFVVLATQLLFVTINVERFKEEKLVSSFYFVVPFLWFITILFGALDTVSLEFFSEISLKGILMAGVSALYFGIWNRLNETKSLPQLFYGVLYVLGFVSAGIAFLDISPLFDGYIGVLVSLLSLVFVFLHLKTPKISRETAFLGLASLGSLLAIGDIENISGTIGVFSISNLIMCLALSPFLAHFVMQKTNDDLFDIRKGLAYFSGMLIILFLGVDIFEDLNLRLDFLFGTIPAGILAFLAFTAATQEKTVQYLKYALILLGIGYFSSFFAFWDKLFPAHADLPFSSFEGPIGLASLLIALFLVKIVKSDAYISYGKNTGLAFLVVAAAVVIAFQFISYEIIAFYNVIVEPNIEMIYLDSITEDSASIIGIRAVLISAWWVVLASGLIFLGIHNSEKFTHEKRMGMALLAFSLGKILLYDIAHLDTNLKVLLFMVTGSIILGLSYMLHQKKNLV